MELLADENFPLDAVAALRENGHDVLWIRESAAGSRDQDILARAMVDDRLLLTFDKDFGELAYRFGLPASCGIVLFRISMESPQHVAHVVTTTLASRDDWPGHFSVIDDRRIRMKLLTR